LSKRVEHLFDYEECKVLASYREITDPFANAVTVSITVFDENGISMADGTYDVLASRLLDATLRQKTFDRVVNKILDFY
jgi:hypothetical protein